MSVDRRAARAIDRLPERIRQRVLTAIYRLADDPRPPGVVKMVGFTNQWRIRVGDYRVIYQIHDARLLVLVIKTAHRREAY